MPGLKFGGNLARLERRPSPSPVRAVTMQAQARPVDLTFRQSRDTQVHRPSVGAVRNSQSVVAEGTGSRVPIVHRSELQIE